MLIDGSVRVRVVAASVHAGDHHMLTGRPYLIRIAVGRRHIPGMDFSGIVDAVGPNGKDDRLAVGDEVFGTADVASGAFAEYVCVPAAFVVKKPYEVDFEAAAAVATSASTALQALRIGTDWGARKSADQEDEHTEGARAEYRVLINGASGGVGSFAVQLARSLGAHVTGVCSTPNVELVRELGAAEVVDYKTENLELKCGGEKFDRIIDCVGNRSPAGWRRLLKRDGALVAVSLPSPESECVPCCLFRVVCFPCCCCCLLQQKFHAFMQEVRTADLQELSDMLAAGTLRVVTGKRFSGLAEVSDALCHGHTAGKKVISIAPIGLKI